MPFGRLSTLGVIAAVLIATACGSAGGSVDRAATLESGNETLVVTTVAPITSIASSVIGDRATIVGLVPEGTNSHTFEPPPSAASALANADVVFINGLQLEEPTRDLAVGNMDDSALLVELGDATITAAEFKFDFSFPEAEGKPNPHLWTDPLLAKGYAERIMETMRAVDPSGAAQYEANYAEFAAIVDDLDVAIGEAFATIAEADRKLVTYHDAYAYFADTYGWTVIGAIQPADFGEPTPAEVVRLIEQIRAESVPAVFGSEVFPSPVLEQVAKETGATYIDELRDDDLPGEPGDPEHSWLGLMRFNFITMTDALGGDSSAIRNLELRQVGPDLATYPQ
ncbi:MAG: zinc ABC transporter substrate-binding protein [Acidimicrobiales bacterium]|nr:zinc ABC transporter substrate-binding protein [Acidimicrobiales bacterium]